MAQDATSHVFREQARVLVEEQGEDGLGCAEHQGRLSEWWNEVPGAAALTTLPRGSQVLRNLRSSAAGVGALVRPTTHTP